ncbi:MAG TPA: NAD(P)-binding domain-containing protein [Trueperaceae bacterium]|jgi:predicted dinucleotide-binding enzyme|nr:NAD(P)-binding domain-containing protein [Trueperaceae bacterium]
MRIAVLGTSMVGQTLSGKLSELGHDVMVGTRDVAQTLAKTEPHPYGFPAFSTWQQQHPQVQLGTFAQAAAHGELLFNATNGAVSVGIFRSIGEAHLKGKILVDVANPLDFAAGNPPALAVANTDSLGEQLQRAFPDLKVVKALNTVTAALMVAPRQLANGEHTIFVSGNDAEAKDRVTDILKDWFGWQDVIDLGDITTARGTEMYLPLWLRLWGKLGTGMFNVRVTR